MSLMISVNEIKEITGKSYLAALEYIKHVPGAHRVGMTWQVEREKFFKYAKERGELPNAHPYKLQ